MVRSISVGHSIIQRRCLHLINIIVANSWEDHYNSSERVRGCLAYSGISKHTGNSNLRLKTPNFICVHTDVKVQVHGYASAYGGKRESVFLSYFTVLFWDRVSHRPRAQQQVTDLLVPSNPGLRWQLLVTTPGILLRFLCLKACVLLKPCQE